ncbi:ROK family protein [Luedemannella helvata]|uniref:ROK family transcriptional regulator n=1 Tax=Luedemannella helvata TaxID=349315 RepID=A0ABP4WX46_9ACTN
MTHPNRSTAWSGRRTADPAEPRAGGAGAVLRAVLDLGPVARSTIVGHAGLSPAAVTRHAAALTGAGYLRELAVERGPRGLGRPHVPLDIDTRRWVVAGVHIGVRQTTLALVDLRGHVLVSEQVPHRTVEAGAVTARVAALLPDFLAAHAGGREILGLGVASGGWVDSAAGVIVENLPLGWRDVPIRDALERVVDVPVLVDGHARALARAEQLIGAVRAKARRSILHLFVGTVVDAAFAAGEGVHHGPRSAAGAIAHLPVGPEDDSCACGSAGCLQAAVSEQTLARRAARAGVVETPSFPAVLDAALRGVPAAVALLRERAELVGRAAALLIDVVNPEVVVVTEAGVNRLPECLARLRDSVRRHSRLCPDAASRVVPSSFAGTVLPVAAAAAVLDGFYADPLGHRTVLLMAS